MSANVRDCPCTYSLLLGIIYMYKLPLSDLYSLFPFGKSKHNNKRTHIRVRLCCIWAKCGIEKVIDGHIVAAQP